MLLTRDSVTEKNNKTGSESKGGKSFQSKWMPKNKKE
jgi:hypothetical protein